MCKLNKVFFMLVVIYLSGCATERFYWSPVKTHPVDSYSEINTSQYKVSSKVAPRYPLKALRIKQEGWVLVSFLVDKYGNTTDVNIVDSSPPKIFNKSVQIALSQWRFKVKNDNDPLLFDSPIYQLFKFDLEN